MPSVTIHARQPNLVIGSIPVNGTITEPIDLDGYSIIGLIAITSLTESSIGFHVSQALNGVYVPLRNDDGTPVATGSQSGTFALSAEGVIKRLSAYRYVRIATSSSQTNGVIFVLPVRA